MKIKITPWINTNSGYYGQLQYVRGKHYYVISYFNTRPPSYRVDGKPCKKGKIPPTYLEGFTKIAKNLGWLKRRKPV